MVLTIGDVTPLALCVVTQELFDSRRFRSNFCDNTILRMKDKTLEPIIVRIKKDLNTSALEKKFLEGYKAVILSNLDKIIGVVSSRYSRVDLRLTEVVVIVTNTRKLMDKVILANSFEEIAKLEPIFKSKITLPVYKMFIEYLKASKS